MKFTLEPHRKFSLTLYNPEPKDPAIVKDRVEGTWAMMQRLNLPEDIAGSLYGMDKTPSLEDIFGKYHSYGHLMFQTDQQDGLRPTLEDGNIKWTQRAAAVFKDTIVTGDGQYIKDPSKMERFDTAVKLVGAPVIRTFYKYGKGLLLGTPEIAWQAVNKAMGETDTKKMTLDEAVDWAMQENPGGFIKAVGEISEFAGAYKTVSPKELPKGLSWLHKAGKAALDAMASKTAREASKRVAQEVNPDAEQPLESPLSALEEGAWMFGFSSLGSAAKAFMDTTLGKAIQEKLNYELLKVLSKHPTLSKAVDSVSENPYQYERAILSEMKSRGVDLRDLTPEARAGVRHMARFWQMRENFAYNPPEDIIYNTLGRKRLTLAPEPISTPTPTVAAKPVSIKPDDLLGAPRVPLGKEGGQAPIIADLTTEVIETSKGLAETIPSLARASKDVVARNVKRASDHFRTLGTQGQKVAKGMDDIAFRAQVNINKNRLELRDIFKGVSKEDRVAIAKALNEKIDAPDYINQRADRLRDSLDVIMNTAKELGVQRKGVFGKMDIKGTGRAFPTVPNKAGQKFLDEARTEGLGSSNVFAYAQQMVNEGKAKNVEEVVSSLQKYSEDQLRGFLPYLERTKLELPDEYIEWDPEKVLPGLIEKYWLNLEAIREWGIDEAGQSLPKLDALIEQIKTKHGLDEAKAVEDFMKAALGKEYQSDKSSRDLAAGIMKWQFLTKVAPRPLTAIRNMLDRYAKGFEIGGLSTNIKATAKYPPIINQMMKSAREIEDSMAEKGAIFGHGSLLEGYEPGKGLADLMAKPFAASELGNQTYIALVKSIKIQEDLKALSDIPEIGRILDKRIGRLISPLEAIGKSPRQAEARLLKDLGSEELLERAIMNESIPDDVLSEILHRTVRDRAFPVILSTKRLWWDNKPIIRLMAQFKTWPIEQAGHIWNDILKDVVKNRDPIKLARWLMATALVGEIYNIARDLTRDKNESALMKAKDGRSASEIGYAILNDLFDGGVVGIFADVVYGIPDMIAGPTAASLKDIGNTATKIVWNPVQIDDALAQAVLNQVPITKDIQSILDKIDRQYDKENLTRDYYKWREYGFKWAEKKRHSTAKDRAKAVAVDVIEGTRETIPTENTLSYEMLQRQLLVGDPEDAAEYIRHIIRTADDPKQALSNLRASVRQRSPLGKVSQEDLPEFLNQFTPEEQQEAMTIEAMWYKNFYQALAQKEN
jgi:hypothetical protein